MEAGVPAGLADRSFAEDVERHQIADRSFAEDPSDYAQGKLSNATLESLKSGAGFFIRVFAEQNSRNKPGKSD